MNNSKIYALTYVFMAFTIVIVTASSFLFVNSGNASSGITVNTGQDNLGDDGTCSLREAIIAINNPSGASVDCVNSGNTNTIHLPPGVYTLSRSNNGNEPSTQDGDLDIFVDLVLEGSGEGSTIIDTQNFSSRIFDIESVNVTISGITISQGDSNQSGGAIRNKGTLNLQNVIIRNNHADWHGGGIYNTSSGVVNLHETAIFDNSAGKNGGGIHNDGGGIDISNTTISGNTSQEGGGGIINTGTTNIHFVTISNNTADVLFSNSNNNENSGGNINNGGGILNLGGQLLADNSIIAGNFDLGFSTVHPDCSGSINSLGYNLVQDQNGCTITGISTGNILGSDPVLGTLSLNGGSSPTHALLTSSPAIDAADPNSQVCPSSDQRGITRPRGYRCDIGAFELEDPGQTGGLIIVNSNDDVDDGTCTFVHCSLREAINYVNSHPNDSVVDEIQFNIPGAGPKNIQLTGLLPIISDPVKIDGTSQPSGAIIVDGSNAGESVNGFEISAGESILIGLEITNFSGNGVLLHTNGQNILEGNKIYLNTSNGILVVSGSQNNFISNKIYENGMLGIDLGNDGITSNDKLDQDTGPNGLQNYSLITNAYPGTGTTTVEGRINSFADTEFVVEVFSSTTCDPSGSGEGSLLVGSFNVTTDSTGDVYFEEVFPVVIPEGEYITTIASGPNGSSEFSKCLPVSIDNDAWTKALRLDLVDSPTPNTKTASYSQFISLFGQSRWYKFSIEPNSRLVVTLTNLPENYDLTVYKDISQALQTLNTPEDLLLLSAEFAPDAFSPDAFSPDAFSPDAFSPDAFSPDAFSPDAFSPDAFSPDAFSPDAFSPDAFSPDAFSPDAFSPDAFSPDAFSPDAFSPDAFSPDAFSPDAFSSAQTRSLVAVSAFDGTTSEGVMLNTWDNTGDFYIRVRGRNGAFSIFEKFDLELTLLTGSCSQVSTDFPPSNTSISAGNYHTIVLSDPGRLVGSQAEKDALQLRLLEFVNRSEVSGAIVDLGVDDRVVAANVQADNNPACPFAKNLVAYSIKEIIDNFWAANPNLKYIVLIGNDSVIPFFRHPDQALLANEKNYVPPVLENTSSQASLKLGYVLSQDAYGATDFISSKTNLFPVLGIPVGRLVETPLEIKGMLEAYLSTSDGVVSTPTSSLVTGYDFLEDVALAVRSELESGIGNSSEALITPRDVSPYDPSAWTADQLRALLLANRYDLIFLSGHFSASSALAADYTTRLLTSEVLSSGVDFTNAIIFSAGCHAGYNIVDPHAVPGVTVQPDWAQTFARKQATLLAGTGYQYGDTDFIEYSEKLYLEFSHQLRTGTGAVAIGDALLKAKQNYLVSTPQLRPLHEKALLEATLFGLPMLSVDMPQGRGNLSLNSSIVTSTQSYSSDPGAVLGLQFSDISVLPTLTTNNVNLLNLKDNSTIVATFLSGSSGILSQISEPTLPLEIRDVSVPGMILRGIGFRGGSYVDAFGIIPLIGSAVTEIRGVHTPFFSDYFYPVKMWSANYFDSLFESGNGETNLFVTPAQFRSDAPGSETSTMRSFQEMGFRLFYSSNTNQYGGGSIPGLAAAPTITKVETEIDGSNVEFLIRVNGNPAAGIQEVWITYTGLNGPLYGSWQSLDLTQDPDESTLWKGSLSLNGTQPEDFRFIVQAVNGVGLVGLATNQGFFYSLIDIAEATNTTELVLDIPVSSGPYGTQLTVGATLTGEGSPLAGFKIYVTVGAQTRVGITDDTGKATVEIPLIGIPGEYPLYATFKGSVDYLPVVQSQLITIEMQNTQIILSPQDAVGNADDKKLMEATLKDSTGRPLGEKTIFFLINGNSESFSIPLITDMSGRAFIGELPISPGNFDVTVQFSGDVFLHTGEILSLEDGRYNPTSATGTLTINAPTLYSIFIPFTSIP